MPSDKPTYGICQCNHPYQTHESGGGACRGWFKESAESPAGRCICGSYLDKSIEPEITRNRIARALRGIMEEARNRGWDAADHWLIEARDALTEAGWPNLICPPDLWPESEVGFLRSPLWDSQLRKEAFAVSWSLSVSPPVAKEEFDAAVDAAQPTGQDATLPGFAEDVAAAKESLKALGSRVKRSKVSGYASGHSLQEGDNWSDSLSTNVNGSN